MTARLTMPAMHRDGTVTLPPPRRAPGRLRKPEPGPETGPPQAPMPETPDAVRPVRPVRVTGAGREASRVRNGFAARRRCLGRAPLAGARMRCAVEDREGRPLAMPGFPAAAWKTAPRGAFTGRPPEVRERNLQRVTGSPRHLTMPWVRIPDLAPRILSGARRRLPQDRHGRYRAAPVLTETFAGIPPFTGAVRKASGRIHAGTALGRGRHGRKNGWAKPGKDIRLCPLRRDWKRTLSR